MEFQLPQIQWTFTLAGLVALGLLFGVVKQIAAAIKSVSSPLKEFVEEHNVLWEDYNLRTGGTYRRVTGRGSPPEPSDFYQDHHDRK